MAASKPPKVRELMIGLCHLKPVAQMLRPGGPQAGAAGAHHGGAFEVNKQQEYAESTADCCET